MEESIKTLTEAEREATGTVEQKEAAISEQAERRMEKISEAEQEPVLSDLQRIIQEFALEKQDYRCFSALTLAYIGDAVFDLVIRTVVVMRSHKQVNDLHRKTTGFVKAETQAVIIQGLLDHEILTEEEKAVYKRGRNTKSHTVAKNASMAAYRKATGFEAVFGYLYLTGQMERILELTQIGISYADLTL